MSDKIQALREKWMATACGSTKEFDAIVEIVREVAFNYDPPSKVVDEDPPMSVSQYEAVKHPINKPVKHKKAH